MKTLGQHSEILSITKAEYIEKNKNVQSLEQSEIKISSYNHFLFPTLMYHLDMDNLHNDTSEVREEICEQLNYGNNDEVSLNFNRGIFIHTSKDLVVTVINLVDYPFTGELQVLLSTKKIQ